MEDFITVINTLGGGLSAAVIVALGWTVRQKDARIDVLTDKIITMAADTQRVLGDLAHKIDAATRGKP